MKAALCLLVVVLAAPAARAQAPKSKTAQPYYYPVAQTDDPMWTSPTPPCASLSAQKYAALKKARKCKVEEHAPGRTRCFPKDTMEASHVDTGEKKKFAAAWFVFETEKACVKDREAFLSGEE